MNLYVVRVDDPYLNDVLIGKEEDESESGVLEFCCRSKQNFINQ